MKIKILLWLLALLPFASFAQVYNGYVVNRDGDTVSVKLYNPLSSKNCREISFRSNTIRNKSALSPALNRKVFFSEEYAFDPVKYNDSYRWARVLISGKDVALLQMRRQYYLKFQDKYFHLVNKTSSSIFSKVFGNVDDEGEPDYKEKLKGTLSNMDQFDWQKLRYNKKGLINGFKSYYDANSIRYKEGFTVPDYEFKFYIGCGLESNNYKIDHFFAPYPYELNVLSPEISGGIILKPNNVNIDMDLALGIEYQPVSSKKIEVQKYRGTDYYLDYDFSFNKLSIPLTLSIWVFSYKSLNVSLQGGYKYIILNNYKGSLTTEIDDKSTVETYDSDLIIPNKSMRASVFGLRFEMPLNRNRISFNVQTEALSKGSIQKITANQSLLNYKGAGLKASLFYTF